MKMAGRNISVAVAVAAVLVVVVGAGMAEAQTPPDCAAKVASCGEFIKSNSKPSATCCGSIKEAVETQLDCLCNLYSSGTLTSLGINITDALHLTEACGLPDDLSKCNKTSSLPPGSSPSVPRNDAEKLVSTGFASILFLFLASLVLH